MLSRVIEDKIFHEPMSGCWLWGGALVDGYAFGWDPESKKRVRVHRHVYKELRGPVADDVLVCHTCDNRACVNPDHLFLGSDRDNTDDKCRKNRQARQHGERNGSAKLTTEKAMAILNSPSPYAEIAAEFGVHVQTVYRIKAGTRWKHLGGRRG